MTTSRLRPAAVSTALWLVPRAAAAHSPTAVAHALDASLVLGIAGGLAAAAVVVRMVHVSVGSRWPWLRFAAWALGLSVLCTASIIALGFRALYELFGG